MVLNYLHAALPLLADSMATHGEQQVELQVIGLEEMTDKGPLLQSLGGKLLLPRKWVYYNDSDDVSRVAYDTIEAYFRGKKDTMVIGGSLFCNWKTRTINPAALIRAGICLQGSGRLDGFLQDTIDLGADIRAYYANIKFKDLAKANPIKTPKGQLAFMLLYSVGQTKMGHVLLGFARETDWSQLKLVLPAQLGLHVDIEATKALVDNLDDAGKRGVDGEAVKLDGAFHANDVAGRGVFGGKLNQAVASEDELRRLFGMRLTPKSREDMMLAWYLVYQNRIALKLLPDPQATSLILFPTKSMSQARITASVTQYRLEINEYFEVLKAKKVEKAMADLAERASPTASTGKPLLPATKPCHALVVTALGRNGFLSVEQVLVATDFDYVKMVMMTSMRLHYEEASIALSKRALAGDSKSPSAYTLWSYHLTSILQKTPIAARMAYEQAKMSCSVTPNEDLNSHSQPVRWWVTCTKARLLFNLLIQCAQEGKVPNKHTLACWIDGNKSPDSDNGDYSEELKIMIETLVNGADTAENVLGTEVYQALNDADKFRVDYAARVCLSGIDKTKHRLFMRGFLLGLQLKKITWILEQNKRRLSPSGGRHLTYLRGTHLQSSFAKGLGLLENLKAATRDPQARNLLRVNKHLPLWVSAWQEDSKNADCNFGLIAGIVTYIEVPKKS
jgi:hypothetical protein